MSLVKRLAIIGVCTAGIAAGCAPAGPGGATPGPQWETPRAGAETPREAEEAHAPAVFGVIVSRSGSPFLEQYGALVLEGVQLAVQEHNRSGGRPIELVERDDGGDPSRVPGLVAELEGRGAVAIIGPLRPDALSAAARARRDSLLAIVSPTSSEVPPGEHIYSLNAGDTRGAEVLAEYAVRSGLRRIALLYPRTREFGRQARAFARSLAAAGGEVVVEIAFDSGTTTFAEPMRSLVEVAPEAVFIPASARDVRQIAPQVTYYGLGGAGVQVLGSEAWTSEEVRRQVAARYLEGVIAATPLFEQSPAVGWQEFVSLYETTYRRTLDNPLPALGFDAASLLINAIADEPRVDAATVVGGLDRIEELRGATGSLTVRAGEVVRQPILVRIEQGKLVPVGSRPDAPSPSPGAGRRGSPR